VDAGTGPGSPGSITWLNGLDATRQILRSDPEQRVLILTIAGAEQVIEEGLKAGARGFVLKADAAQDLTMAVEALQQDRTFFSSRAGEMVLNGFLGGGGQAAGKRTILPRLTPREREVVQLLAEGKSTKEVAVMLDLRVKTAETQRSNIMRKLGLHCLSELVLYAVRNRLEAHPRRARALCWPPHTTPEAAIGSQPDRRSKAMCSDAEAVTVAADDASGPTISLRGNRLAFLRSAVDTIRRLAGPGRHRLRHHHPVSQRPRPPGSGQELPIAKGFLDGHLVGRLQPGRLSHVCGYVQTGRVRWH
jgi:DNA-binding NarL/FixJ family response regulator